jgi:hypothetical protein
MTLKITETVDMELVFELPGDEAFTITTRFVNPATRELFRLLNASPRMLAAVEELLSTPYDEYHAMGRAMKNLEAIVDEVRGGV